MVVYYPPRHSFCSFYVQMYSPDERRGGNSFAPGRGGEIQGFRLPVYEAVVLRLAERVQQLRKNLGMTQAALASRAGVTVETVARLERVVRGRLSANSNPSLETLARLALALEVELHELLGPDPAVQKKNSQLTYMLEGVSPSMTRRITRVVEALLRDEDHEIRHSTIRDLGSNGSKKDRPGISSG